MDYKRVVLYFALAFVVFSLWTAWLRDYPATPIAVPTTTTQETNSGSAATTANTNAAVPIVPQQQSQAAQKVQTAATAPIVTVHTDVLDVKIDTNGGNIISAALPKYPAEVKTPKVATEILNNNPNTMYIAESGLTGPQGPDTQAGQVTYKATQTDYTLAPDQKELTVDLTWKNKAGLQVTKSFLFTRDNYAIHVNYKIQNKGPQPWSGNFYGQIRRQELNPPGGLFHFSTYTGAAISSAEKPYQKITFAKMGEENLNKTIRGGWLAMQERYFLSAWIPNPQQANRYYSEVNTDKVYTLGFIGPTITVPAGDQFNTTSSLYVGPELENNLKAVAPHLDLTIDFGWLWWISVPILWVMEKIHKVVGNWGWSIVLVTILIKAMFYKLSAMSYRSMARMRQLQPKLAELKERLGDDRQKLSQATMELYRKEKINPLGGCLPILVQIPVFIALYYVLLESVQLRQAPFILWIHDLSARDPYFILPLLMGISMYVQQRLNPAPPDKAQAMLMQYGMPVMFTFFFLSFPSGLVVYWLTNNCLSILQQWHITREIEAKIVNKIERVFEHPKKPKE
jgi:YidC/Oxa1 family membrane protein insertase